MRRPFLIALFLPALAFGAGEDVSVPAPVSLFDSAALAEYGPPLMRGEQEEEPQRYVEQRDALAGALESFLLDEAEAAGGSLYASGDDLVVAGGPDVVELVRRRVSAIAAFVEGRATMSVAAVHVDDARDAQTADTIRDAVRGERARVVWSSRISSHRGEPIVRNMTEETSFVADFDVEVAQSASIADPVVATLITGWRISIQQRALDAERMLVSLAFHLSILEGMEPVAIGAGTFQRPRVPFVAATTTMLVERGRPGVVFVDHPSGDGVLAVVVDAVDLPRIERQPFRLIDAAAHTGVGSRPADLSVGLHEYDTKLPEPVPYATAEALVERIVVADAGVPLTPCIVALTDSEFAPPDPRPQRLVRRTWRAVEVAALPGYDPLDGSLTEEAVAALLARAPDTWTSLSALRGTRTMHQAGVWTRVVSDYDVEIADTAVMTDPIVYSFIEGDLLEVAERGVSALGDIDVRWSAARTLHREMAGLVVRKDISGRRLQESDDRIDVLRHRSWNGRLVVTGATPADVRLTGKTAEIDLWTRD